MSELPVGSLGVPPSVGACKAEPTALRSSPAGSSPLSAMSVEAGETRPLHAATSAGLVSVAADGAAELGSGEFVAVAEEGAVTVTTLAGLDDAAEEPHAASPPISAIAPSPAQIFLVFMISPQEFGLAGLAASQR